MAAIFQKTITLSPSPGFVVKTRILEGQGDHLYSTKVFLNICHDPQVPKPPITFNPETVFPLIVNNEWEVPIITSPEKKSPDKKGVPSFVYDCCINPECFQWVQVSADLRSIVIEWCLEAVEMLHDIVLEREYSVPKMLQKGELSHTEISEEELQGGLHKRLHELKQSETLGLIEEIRQDPDDGPLPSLMDISGSKTRPLIEEIEDMTISAPESKKESKDAMRDATMGHEKNIRGTEPVPYTFSITRKQREGEFYIMFESEQLTRLEVSFDTAAHELVLRNCDPARKLGSANRLELPIPAAVTPYKAFVVGQSKLYVFCR